MEQDELRDGAAREALRRASEITKAGLKAEKAIKVVFWLKNYAADALRRQPTLTYEPGHADSYYGSEDAQAYVLDCIATMMPEIYARARSVAEQQIDDLIVLTARDSDSRSEAGETACRLDPKGNSAGLEEASPTPGIHQEHA